MRRVQPRRTWFDLLSAVQFLTRLRVPTPPYEQDSLARAVKFFPLVGLLIGSGSAALDRALTPHLPALVVALLVVVYMIAITGCLHEDGLADAADGFGGGWDREKVLAIMRDSRIGTYGAVAVVLSVLARVLLIASLPQTHVSAYLLVAPVLSRWTTLPLSFILPPARNSSADQVDGQGARIARLTTSGSLVIGSVLSLVMAIALLRSHALAPVLASLVMTLVTALYYRYRIGGITGDCFGATNQLTEIAVYLCGVWI
ncbi:adenosylcobinamide-GDP ribazoletransferase [Silvibacterium dinghuense]|uniref:Adenosylcobinamide-GDP ribazoletransferase n=2 Tax=Silvibacterium dinghuense TaxID=1560006 RepID=A0A4Q1SKJ1_9BACT|nr:adenosylcobinamide-GDP ribazoletransferase [Silvibacterium dinghuense]